MCDRPNCCDSEGLDDLEHCMHERWFPLMFGERECIDCGRRIWWPDE